MNFNSQSRLGLQVVILLAALSCGFSQQSWAARQSQHPHLDGNVVGYLLYKPLGYDQNQDLYPTILFLHGMGERAQNNGDQGQLLHLVDNTGLPQVLEQGLEIPFLVISPQVRWSWNGSGSNLKSYVDYLKTLYRIDPSRLYVTGLSDGGKGVWNYSRLYPEEIAAIIPVSTWPDSSDVNAYLEMPVWAFMGNGDTYGGMMNFVNAIAAAGGDAQFTLMTNATDQCGSCGHGASVWNTVYWGQHYDIYSWLLTQSSEATPPQNIPPVANAGEDGLIFLPEQTFELTGSGTDSDGLVVSYLWEKLSGPCAVIVDPSSAQTQVTNLTEGDYVFRLTVTDDDGATHSDEVSVTVLPDDPQGTPAKLVLAPSMVTNESGLGDAGMLVDEQVISGDPLNGPGGSPVTYWHVSYNAGDFPAHAYIDLGEPKVITEVFLRDYQGIGDIIISAGAPGDWTEIIVDPMELYNRWKRHTQSALVTRYIRVTRLQYSGRMSEIVLYGY